MDEELQDKLVAQCAGETVTSWERSREVPLSAAEMESRMEAEIEREVEEELRKELGAAVRAEIEEAARRREVRMELHGGDQGREGGGRAAQGGVA